MQTFFLLALILIFGSSGTFGQWKKQSVNTTASLRGLSVVNEKVAWASGTGGTVIKTTDGGGSWKVGSVPGAEKLDFRDVEAFDAKTAYVLSIGNGEDSRIYKTTDGGGTWKLQFKNTNAKAFFDALACWDRKNCIAMSDPVDGKYVLIATADGENWKPLDTSRMPAAKDGEAAFAASGTCLITHGKNNVFLVSGGSDARVFRSNDRGKIWDVSNTPIVKGTTGSGIFSIAMFDAKNGVIVGGNYEKPEENNGTFATTKDGGKTWTAGKGLGGYRSGVAFLERTILVAVGTNGSDESFSGGTFWKKMESWNFNAVQAKPNIAWAVGPNGLVAKIGLAIIN
ncbi:MAG: glycosyl hydrolase [Pyrinomonadaceae bacterium]